MMNMKKYKLIWMNMLNAIFAYFKVGKKSAKKADLNYLSYIIRFHNIMKIVRWFDEKDY